MRALSYRQQEREAERWELTRGPGRMLSLFERVGRLPQGRELVVGRRLDIAPAEIRERGARRIGAPFDRHRKNVRTTVR